MKCIPHSLLVAILTAFAVLFALSAKAATPSLGQPITIGQRHQIQSAALSAPVSYLVHTPKLYERTDQAYPVVLLLDGDQHFAHVSASMDLLTEQGRIPPAILVAVNNVNRVANLSPPLGQSTATAPTTPTTPNGDKFLRFLSEELIPHVDQTYRTRPYRVLIGHSSGGLFVVYALLQNPTNFNGYVSVSPAIDSEYESLVDAMPSFLANHKSLRADVFLAIGNESGRMLANTWRLSAHFAQNPSWANPNLRWRLNQYPEEDHGTISLRAMEQGLRSIFDDWHLEAEAAISLFEGGGLAALQKHYTQVSERMGYLVPVPRAAFASVVEALRRRNRTDDAKVVLQQAIDTYPEDPEFYFVMGQEYVFTDRPRALEYFAKSLQASPAAYRNAISSYDVDPTTLLPEVLPSPRAMSAYAGAYQAVDDNRTIQARAGNLIMRGAAGDCDMRFLSEQRFYCGSIQGTFEIDRNGRVQTLGLHGPGYRYNLLKVK